MAHSNLYIKIESFHFLPNPVILLNVIFISFLLDQDILTFDISVQIPLLMESFKSDDDFFEDLGGFVKGKYFLWKTGLVVNKVTSIAVLHDKVKITTNHVT